jgi:hypothetical protein
VIESLKNNTKWLLEIIDLYKDIFYFTSFPHSMPIKLALSFSLSIPFALFHKSVIGLKSFSFTHSVLIYLGLTHTPSEKLAREQAAVKIAMFENVIQFTVVFYEIFVFR